ncbi:putative uncharacterized protein [Eubacterium sp. CAG:192]|nr:putative uncharacterized protein [Eubacterium sp. CAG:192]
MGKFNRQLVNEIKKEKEQESAQLKLREKYEVPEDVMIVEKDNMIKFSVRIIATLIKIKIGIIIFLLTVVGIVSLVFPETRNELIFQLSNTLMQLKKFLNI